MDHKLLIVIFVVPDLNYQERGGLDYYEHESLRLQFKLDNEFELIFVVCDSHCYHGNMHVYILGSISEDTTVILY